MSENTVGENIFAAAVYALVVVCAIGLALVLSVVLAHITVYLYGVL